MPNISPRFLDYTKPAALSTAARYAQFHQLSQNANLNVNVLTTKNERQLRSLNMNLGFQDAADEQGGSVAQGSSSQFYNTASPRCAYKWLKQGMNTAAYSTSVIYHCDFAVILSPWALRWVSWPGCSKKNCHRDSLLLTITVSGTIL